MKIRLEVELEKGEADHFARLVDSLRGLVDALDGETIVNAPGPQTPPAGPVSAILPDVPDDAVPAMFSSTVFEPVLLAVADLRVSPQVAADSVCSTITSEGDYPQFEAAMIGVLVDPELSQRGHDRRTLNPELPSTTYSLLSIFNYLPDHFLENFRRNFLRICLVEFRKDRQPGESRRTLYPYADAFAAFVLSGFVTASAALKVILSIMATPSNRPAAFTVLGKTAEMCSQQMKDHAATDQLRELRTQIDSIRDPAYQYDLDYVRSALGWTNEVQEDPPKTSG